MSLKRLRELREDNDLTQAEVARILNISQRAYSGYETGSRMIPYTCLALLAVFYDTSIDYIVGLTDIQKPYEKRGAGN